VRGIRGDRAFPIALAICSGLGVRRAGGPGPMIPHFDGVHCVLRTNPRRSHTLLVTRTILVFPEDSSNLPSPLSHGKAWVSLQNWSESFCRDSFRGAASRTIIPARDIDMRLGDTDAKRFRRSARSNGPGPL